MSAPRLLSLLSALLLMTPPLLAADPATSLAAPTEAARALPAGLSHVGTLEGISEYRLANGLRVLLAPDASKPTTTVNITYLVGSRHENYGETGMAHLLEHLVFKGTPKFPEGALMSEMKKRGMQFNGSTWYDRTNYYQSFAASEDNLDWALAMEADRMVNSFIAQKDLDSEMSVVRNEMESGENSPGMMLWQKLTAVAYQWHNYGKSTIGARADVENVNIERLQAFYRKYYQPDNAVLVVTGQFDAARTLDKIAQHFGRIARPGRVLDTTYTREPVQDGPRELTLQRVGDAQKLAVLYHTVAGAHPDAAALEVLGFVLADTPSGRLHKALVMPRKATSVDVFNAALAEPGYLSFFIDLDKRQSADTARQILLRELEQFAKQAPTEAEVARAKTAHANAFEKALADPTQFGVALSEAIALGDWRLFFLNRDRIAAVTAADVLRVAQNYLKASNRSLGLFVPTDKPDRVQPQEAKPVADMLAGYSGRAALAEGEAFDPSPANIEARTHKSKLANGMQLALLAKKNRGETVSGTLVLRMGDAKSLFGQRSLADAVAEMLLRGAGGKSRQQIADELDRLKSQVQVSSPNGNAVVLNFESRRDTLPELLTLLRQVLRQPDFPASEFEQLRNEALAAIEETRREPRAMATRAMARHDNPYLRGDLRYEATLDEALAALKGLKHAELKRFHQRFYGASHAQLAIVGDFDRAAVEAQLGKLFGDWRSTQPYARVDPAYRQTRSAVLTLAAPDKANAFYIGGIAVPLRDDHAAWPALVLADRILGGGGLKSRIADRLRQREGISYGAGSALRGNPREANAAWLFYAIYAPQNLARLQSGLAEEFARFFKDGVEEGELADAKSGLLQERRIARTQDAALSATLASQLELARDMRFEAQREAALAAVSKAEVDAALRQYFDPARLLQVYAGDFAKPAPAAAASAPANAP